MREERSLGVEAAWDQWGKMHEGSAGLEETDARKERRAGGSVGPLGKYARRERGTGFSRCITRVNPEKNLAEHSSVAAERIDCIKIGCRIGRVDTQKGAWMHKRARGCTNGRVDVQMGV